MSNQNAPSVVFEIAIREHLEVASELLAQCELLEKIGGILSTAIRDGRKILWCGNGGSAADSQHLAAEIVGRFCRERRGLPSIALTTDTSILTSIGNDYGFECIFSRQVEALACGGDVLIGISTSGNSKNVVAAMELAHSMGLTTIAFTGAGGGKLGEVADHLLAVPSTNAARIQECHILAGHMLCDRIEKDYVDSAGLN